MRKQPVSHSDCRLANSGSDRKVTQLISMLNEFEMIADSNCGLLIEYVGERVCMLVSRYVYRRDHAPADRSLQARPRARREALDEPCSI